MSDFAERRKAWLEKNYGKPGHGELLPAADTAEQIGRELLSGVTMGFSERLLPFENQLGDTGFSGTAANVAGSMVGGGLLGRGLRTVATRAIPAIEGLLQSSRLANTGMAALEGGIQGGLEGASSEEGDALSGGLFGGAMGAGTTGVMKAADRLLGWGVEKAVKPKESTGVIQKAFDLTGNPFDAPPYIEDPGINTPLMEMLQKRGIEPVPTVVRAQDPKIGFLTAKATQMANAAPYLRAQAGRIEDAFMKWQGDIVTQMGQGKSPQARPNRLVGISVRDHYDQLSGTMKKHGQRIYDELFENEKLGEKPIRAMELATDLERFLESKGYGTADVPGKITVIKQFIRTTRKAAEDGGVVNYNRAWNLAKEIYPNRRGAWDDIDFVNADAWKIIKAHLKINAEELDPKYGPMLAEADLFWKKFNELEGNPVAQIIKKTDPSKLVKRLAGDVGTLQQVRAFYGPSGQDMVNEIARSRVTAILRKGIDPKTGKISVSGLSDALERTGGDDAGLDGAYMAELFRDAPEALEELKSLKRALVAYEYPLRAYGKAGHEAVTGGAEAGALQQQLSSIEKGINLLTSWAIGRKMGELMTNTPPHNPFLGGSMPMGTGRIARTGDFIANQARRGALGAGAASAGADSLRNRLMGRPETEEKR